MGNINIAIIGATGLVGMELLKLFEEKEKHFQKINITLFASKKSLNQKIKYKDNFLNINEMKEDSFKNIDYAFFCISSELSQKYMPFAEKYNTQIIDLSSAYRMNKNIPLIIPEINGHLLKNKTNIIASPNCTTTIMLMALCNLHKKYRVKRIITSTYQAASGGGYKLIDKLFEDSKKFLENKDDKNNEKDFYGFNLFLHNTPHSEEKYSDEELKMEEETQKILDDKSIKVSATCVRVPVLRAHSISLNVEFEKKFDLDDCINIIKKDENLQIAENFDSLSFATPLLASKKNKTFVSRIRKDRSNSKCLEMWVVGDQLLKGAALNAFQIFCISCS